MHSSVEQLENTSVDRDFARFTSPTIRAFLGTNAIVATPVTAALFDVGSVPGWAATGCAGAVLTLTHLGLQFQAAIFVLRDSRWLPAVLAAALCAATLAALYLLALDHGEGWYLLLISAVAVAAYVSSVGPPTHR
ncbi:hypothetical protein CYJ73_11450 [Gordonia terrae]|uniref:Uncharacterized protein n=1 Tax=Gordonia terrae TaxID=2055 RepID=A0A2I1R832_9ACTN|nr:hypothetical protein [Gordonia terrae]PKZ65294.1 hypothetical protein CYJ73_11450 [Gordonia terrae]